MRKALVPLLFSLLISLPAGADEIKLQDNPPDRYVVVKGDTLWDISGRFLKEPWRWPEVWRLNKAEIKDPHWIYPGDVVVLDNSGASPRLHLVKSEKFGSGTDKLSPQIRVVGSHATAIPSIPPAAIEPFLKKPLVTEAGVLDKAPIIAAPEEGRVILGAGNRAYARGIEEKDGAFWQVYRPGKELIDPDSKETLGYEAIYLGEAQVTKFAEISTINVLKSNQEILTGDRLVPPPQDAFSSYVPHAPDKAVKGRIISVYGGVAEAGQNAVVAINLGRKDGMEVGHVLALLRYGEISRARIGDQTEVKLPDERYGLIFVFRTFERVAYALVVQATRPVHALDMVETP